MIDYVSRWSKRLPRLRSVAEMKVRSATLKLRHGSDSKFRSSSNESCTMFERMMQPNSDYNISYIMI